MTKTDQQLTDYLGECLKISYRDFATHYFHVMCITYLYKKHGDTFLNQLRKRAWGESS